MRKVILVALGPCGKKQFGQSGKCTNNRFREHHSNVEKLVAAGHRACHCKRHSFKPLKYKGSLMDNGGGIGVLVFIGMPALVCLV